MSKKLIPTICVSGDVEKGNVYLTAGIQPPYDEGTSFEQIQAHSEFQSYASGGSIMHMNLTEQMSSEKKCTFIHSLFNNFPMRYITMTPVLSICQSCGKKIVGKKNTCSICESHDIIVFSRVVGYFRPASRGNLSDDLRKFDFRFWNKGRYEEFLRRKMIDNDCVDGLLKQQQELLA